MISIFEVISIFWHQWIGGRERQRQYEQEKKWKEVALRVVVPKHLLKISGALLFLIIASGPSPEGKRAGVRVQS